MLVDSDGDIRLAAFEFERAKTNPIPYVHIINFKEKKNKMFIYICWAHFFSQCGSSIDRMHYNKYTYILHMPDGFRCERERVLTYDLSPALRSQFLDNWQGHTLKTVHQ